MLDDEDEFSSSLIPLGTRVRYIGCQKDCTCGSDRLYEEAIASMSKFEPGPMHIGREGTISKCSEWLCQIQLMPGCWLVALIPHVEIIG